MKKVNGKYVVLDQNGKKVFFDHAVDAREATTLVDDEGNRRYTDVADEDQQSPAPKAKANDNAPEPKTRVRASGKKKEAEKDESEEDSLDEEQE